MNKVMMLCIAILMMVASLGSHAEMLAPDALVNNIAQDVLSVVIQDKEIRAGNQQAVVQLVEAKVLPHFDFSRMTRLAVGKSWRVASDEQKKILIAEFRNLLVNTYTNAFTRYQNQTVRVLPIELATTASEVTIRTFILEPNNKRVSVDYEMAKTPNGWKVFDLTVEGVSLVINYRSAFASEIRQGGIAGLIQSLVKKNSANNQFVK